MKKIQKLMMLSMLIVSTQSLFATKNKQQIFLTNNYGSDVNISLKWASKSYFGFSRSQDLVLRDDDKDLMIKAPLAEYKLVNIKATPQSSVENSFMDEENDDYGLTSNEFTNTNNSIIAELNTDSLDQLRIGTHTSFTVESAHKKIQATGEEKIRIKGSHPKKVHEEKQVEEKSVPTRKSLPEDHLPVTQNNYASSWPLY